MKLTPHSIKRGRHRAKLSKKELFRHALKALEEGLGIKDVCGKLKKYLFNLYRRRRKEDKQVKLYDGFIYIFTGETLITVIELPVALEDYEQYIKE